VFQKEIEKYLFSDGSRMFIISQMFVKALSYQQSCVNYYGKETGRGRLFYSPPARRKFLQAGW
jgi:hypothetical protein